MTRPGSNGVTESSLGEEAGFFWTGHTEYMKARILLMVAACLVTISMSMHLTAQSGQASAQTSRAPGVDRAHALG